MPFFQSVSALNGLKGFIYSQVTVSYILHAATISVAPTKVVSIHLIMIRKKFPFFQVIYYLPKRKIYHKENYGYITDS